MSFPLTKTVSIAFVFSFCFLIFLGQPTRADVFTDTAFGNNLQTIADVTGYQAIDNPSEKLPLYIAGLVAWTGIMGIGIFIHVMLGAYEYLTAHDNAEKVVNAKKRIRNAIYGAIILVSGYILVAGMIALLTEIFNYPS